MKRINFKPYEENEIRALSSLRGLLALLVALCHCVQIFWLPISGVGSLENKIIGSVGNLSVVIFFIISGMVISYSALRQLSLGEFYAWEFFKKRFLRIYPPLIFMLLLVLILFYLHRLLMGDERIILHGNELYIARDSFTIPLDDITSLLLMQPSGISQINGVLWSLYIEWWLYMSFMCFFLTLTTRSVLIKVIAFVFAVIFLIICWRVYVPQAGFYMGCWLIGAIYTIFLRSNDAKKALSIIGGALIAVHMMTVGPDFAIISATDWVYYGHFQMLLALLLVSWLTSCNAGRFFEKTAQFSYSLYILHFPIFLFLFSTFHQYFNSPAYNFVVGLLAFVVAYTVSKASAKYTEQFHIEKVEKLKSSVVSKGMKLEQQ